MYLIIDNDVAHRLVKLDDEDGAEIRRWIRDYGRIIAGGGLLREYRTRALDHPFRRYLLELARSGRIEFAEDDSIDDRALWLERNVDMRSRDFAIIAIAQLSGARALWSNDNPLIEDFKSKHLIDRPRGVVFHPEGSARRRRSGLKAICRVCVRAP